MQPHLRGIVLDEAVTEGLFGVRVNRHPKSILLDNPDLAVDLADDVLQLLELFRRNNRQVVDDDDVTEPGLKLQLLPREQIVVIITEIKQTENCEATIIFGARVDVSAGASHHLGIPKSSPGGRRMSSRLTEDRSMPRRCAAASMSGMAITAAILALPRTQQQQQRRWEGEEKKP